MIDSVREEKDRFGNLIECYYNDTIKSFFSEPRLIDVHMRERKENIDKITKIFTESRKEIRPILLFTILKVMSKGYDNSACRTDYVGELRLSGYLRGLGMELIAELEKI